MKSRRNFIKLSALGSAAVLTTSCIGAENDKKEESKINDENKVVRKPVVISTWNFGMEANAGAWEVLSKGGSALDAVEAGVRITESDADNLSVGLGGLPDREGIITLDACIMNENSQCGAVAGMQDIEHPVSVARKVMEETPHVMLVGAGAKQFALEQGFEEKDLSTEKSRKAYEEWKVKSEYKPVINSELHDTIGMLAMDANGKLSGACTTSGMAYKMHGRVGDSPLIGAGLFVDQDAGAATATGLGEAIVRVSGSAMVVELMRNGMSPVDACKEVVERILKKHADITDLQAGFIAMNKFGETGGYAVYKGFNYSLRTEERNEVVDAEYKQEWD